MFVNARQRVYTIPEAKKKLKVGEVGEEKEQKRPTPGTDSPLSVSVFVLFSETSSQSLKATVKSDLVSIPPSALGRAAFDMRSFVKSDANET